MALDRKNIDFLAVNTLPTLASWEIIEGGASVLVDTATLPPKSYIGHSLEPNFNDALSSAEYRRLTNLYSSNLNIAIRRRILAQGSEYQMGDVNMDGIVNKSDVTEILNIIANNIQISEELQNITDVDGNGVVDSGDTELLLQSIQGTNSNDILPKTNIYSFNSLIDGTILTNDPLAAGENAIYFLWLYLDETTPNQAQKTFFVGNLDIKAEYIPAEYMQ